MCSTIRKRSRAISDGPVSQNLAAGAFYIGAAAIARRQFS